MPPSRWRLGGQPGAWIDQDVDSLLVIAQRLEPAFDASKVSLNHDKAARVGHGRHFCVCLKYFKSGGGWSFLAGIK